jgi:hypothetical protein
LVCLLFGVGQINWSSGITEAFWSQSFGVSVFPIGCERKRPRGVTLEFEQIQDSQASKLSVKVRQKCCG